MTAGTAARTGWGTGAVSRPPPPLLLSHHHGWGHHHGRGHWVCCRLAAVARSASSPVVPAAVRGGRHHRPVRRALLGRVLGCRSGAGTSSPENRGAVRPVLPSPVALRGPTGRPGGGRGGERVWPGEREWPCRAARGMSSMASRWCAPRAGSAVVQDGAGARGCGGLRGVETGHHVLCPDGGREPERVVRSHRIRR